MSFGIGNDDVISDHKKSPNMYKLEVSCGHKLMKLIPQAGQCHWFEKLADWCSKVTVMCPKCQETLRQCFLLILHPAGAMCSLVEL